MTEKEKSLLNKLKALASKGVNGEKIAAEKKLKQLMEKLGISESDLEEEVKQMYIFKFKKNTFEEKILFQVIVSTFPDAEEIRGYQNKNEWHLGLTPAQAIELKAKYEFYCKAFEKDLEIFYLAFLNSNNLWNRYAVNADDSKPTAAERKKHMKAYVLSAGLEPHQYNKQLKNKE